MKEFSQIHQKWFEVEPIINDMITETEISTSMEELNQVMKRGICRMKKVN